ncbi:MAG: hypothetical protein A7315_03250 [Candidatus Altiarchaeales archaeon WOR_SM1_79]|nr:MAG: hypothetical protein A7315_03250 [Candidatus Altiarchaeales archaeon WOR_SM1_79]
MKKKDVKAYSLFSGCLIPSAYPFIEKASRKVLEALDIELYEIREASCCPNQMAIKSSDSFLWQVLAARNLCLAEKLGHDILTLCNGCYDTLKTTNSKLKGDDKFRKEINKKLKQFDLEFHGTIEVKHILQVLHDDIGLSAIDKKVINSLQGMKFAPFTGCHLKRPMDHMGFDDPEEPKYLGELIKAMGGESILYAEINSCCAGGLSIGRQYDVVPTAKRILKCVLDSGSRAMVVCCPFCFAQFYRSQSEIMDIYSESLKVPVFYITELMGLAFGIDPKELGMQMHYEGSFGGEKEIVKEILQEKVKDNVYNEEVTESQLQVCAKCLACTDDCPTAMTVPEYKPDEILDLVLSGKVDEAIKREDIWFCMNCHECIDKCPQGFGIVKLIIRLKNLAHAKGIYPEVIGRRISELYESGYSFSPNKKIREYLDLPEIKMPEIKKLRKLMEKARSENSSNRGD